MKKLTISFAVLGVVLLGSPCVSSDLAVLSPPTHHHPHHLAKSSGGSSVEDSLDYRTIVVSGRTLKVELGDNLRQKLIEEQDSEDKKITELFLKYFEETKLSKFSEKVVGIIFKLNGERVYRQTFSGNNAR